ncbi:MAG: HAMP domain-containing protein [Boseongicola sp. SB0675_bin_26]|nr:HAMP domain-containing protein [Boseongicola sp. SB0675_bin_26]
MLCSPASAPGCSAPFALKLAPTSLAGQLTLLLLVALALAQGVAVALFAWERIEAKRHAYRDNAVLRTETVVRLLGGAPPELHDAVIAAASSEFVLFSLTDEPEVSESGTDERLADIARDLAATLGIDPERIRMAPLRTGFRYDDGLAGDREHVGGGEHGRGDVHGHQEPDWFTASVALSGDQWLNVRVFPPPDAPLWGWTFVLTFLFSALVIAAVAVLAARRIVRPMRSLAAAASRFGLGETVDDLPEEGPVETRETVRAFNLMRGRLDRYLRERTAMLAAVSHDLRTPITSLRLHAEFVESQKTKMKIYAALDEMQRMIEDTLAFIREDMQREETRKVDLNALIDSVAADLSELGHDIEVIESNRVLVACRPVALRRALRNLMENAATYGSRGTVRTEKDDTAIRVFIEDEGQGIPEADLERVFDPFVRLETSRNRDTGGSGLGLAIARSIVRGHGGGVLLGNRAKGGLRATVVLPIAERR